MKRLNFQLKPLSLIFGLFSVTELLNDFMHSNVLVPQVVQGYDEHLDLRVSALADIEDNLFEFFLFVLHGRDLLRFLLQFKVLSFKLSACVSEFINLRFQEFELFLVFLYFLWTERLFGGHSFRKLHAWFDESIFDLFL